MSRAAQRRTAARRMPGLISYRARARARVRASAGNREISRPGPVRQLIVHAVTLAPGLAGSWRRYPGQAAAPPRHLAGCGRGRRPAGTMPARRA